MLGSGLMMSVKSDSHHMNRVYAISLRLLFAKIQDILPPVAAFTNME